MSLTRREKAFLARARGPGEKAYEAKLVLKFLASPDLSFEQVAERVFAAVRGDLGGLTMPTKRIDTQMELSVVDLPCRRHGQACMNTTDRPCGFCDLCCGHARGICAKKI